MSATGPACGGVWRAIRGALEGAVIVGLGALFGALVSGPGVALAVPLALLGAAFGAVIFATGRAVAGRVGGAALVGTAGLVLGGYCGHHFLGEYSYAVPDAIQPGQDLEIAGPTVQGPPFDLKALRGKVVLVDFWATWCGPCVAELPNVRAVYDRYHAEGFEVVGISLDHSRGKLAEYVKEKQIPWPQVFFDEEGKRGWANPLARRYGVEGIPEMFLVDAEGRVVHEEVRGEALAPAVARLLDKTAPAAAGPAAPRMKKAYWLLAGFGLWLLAGALLGCFVGSLGGALAERALRRPGQGAAGGAA
jgi:thiol-disulfide isomerase/thioredoxin